MGLGVALENPEVEIHLVVRDHGRRVWGGQREQVTNFLAPHCRDPRLMIPGGKNVCQDVQFAVFRQGQQGETKVFRSPMANRYAAREPR